MPKYKYVGKEPQNLAQVGMIQPGDEITVPTEIGDQLEKHAPEQFTLVKSAPKAASAQGGEADKK